MSGVRLDEILEAVLLAASEPLPVERLEKVFDEQERPPRQELRQALAALTARLDDTALELIESASGFQLRIRQRLSPWVSRLWDERPQRYSRALLETLALIAYRQPVTRGDIEGIRGVSVSSSILRTLGERGWVRVVGHRDVPGRPAVYATTRQFLDDFALKTLDALPPMHELAAFEQDATVYTDDLDAPPPAGDNTSGDGRKTAAIEQQTGSDQIPDTTAGTADEQSHAGTASDRPRLSFADLEARLAERAGQGSDSDTEAGADHSTDETSSDP